MIIFSPSLLAPQKLLHQKSLDSVPCWAEQCVFWDALLLVSLYLGCFNMSRNTSSRGFYSCLPPPHRPTPGKSLPRSVTSHLSSYHTRPPESTPLNKCLLQDSWRGGVGEDTVLIVMAIYISTGNLYKLNKQRYANSGYVYTLGCFLFLSFFNLWIHFKAGVPWGFWALIVAVNVILLWH